MTTILFHASAESAFLAGDTLRRNSGSGGTVAARKIHLVSSQVLLGGGGNSNGVAHLLGGLRGFFTNDQGADIAEVLERVKEGMQHCYQRGNSELIEIGLPPVALCIYLAGIGRNGVPRIEELIYDHAGLKSRTITNAFGCMSVDSVSANQAAERQYRMLASAGGRLSLCTWAIHSVREHQELFPMNVGLPVDTGYVLPNKTTAMFGHIETALNVPSLKVDPLT